MSTMSTQMRTQLQARTSPRFTARERVSGRWWAWDDTQGDWSPWPPATCALRAVQAQCDELNDRLQGNIGDNCWVSGR